MNDRRPGLWLLACGAVALSPGAALAASHGPLPAPVRAAALVDEVEDAIADVIDAYDDAMAEFSKLYRAAETDEERNAAFGEHYPDGAEFAAQLWKIVDSDPANPACARALGWVLNNAGADADRAVDLMLEHHIESEEVTVVCMQLERRDHGARAQLERLFELSPHAEVKGLALLSLGSHLMNLASEAERVQAMSEEERETLALQSGEAALVEWMDSDPVELREEGQYLLERVAAEFGEGEHPYGGTLGAKAEGLLFELQNLQVGMPVPEIEGEDLDGVPFKLSDYQGKVVVLDFWGHW